MLASASDGMSASVGMALATVTVLVYTIFGGLLADAWTDLLQGIVLAVGLLVVTLLVVNGLGGIGPAFAEVEASHWALRAPGETTIEVLNRWAIPILGSVTAQELIPRIVACRSPQVAQRAAWMASMTYLLIGVLPVALGLMATQVNLGVVDAEHVLPALAGTPPADVRLRAVRRRAGVGHPVHGEQLPAGGRIHDLPQPRRAAPARDHRRRQAARRHAWA